jgi:hypothetical protein
MEVNGQLHVQTALPLEKEPRYTLNGAWVSPRAGLDAMVKRKIPNTRWEEPRTSDCHTSENHTFYLQMYRVYISHYPGLLILYNDQAVSWATRFRFPTGAGKGISLHHRV